MDEKTKEIEEHWHRLNWINTEQVEYLLSRIKELEERLKDERVWFDRKVELNVKLIKELEKKEAHIKELETALDITTGALEGSQGVVRELKEWIEKVLLWRNLDGDGISDPLRKELYELVKRG